MKRIIPRILINNEIVKSIEQIIKYRNKLSLFQQYEDGNLYIILNQAKSNIFTDKPYDNEIQLMKDYYSLFDYDLTLFNKDLADFINILNDLKEDKSNAEKLNELLSYEVFLIFLINYNKLNLFDILNDNSLEIHTLLNNGNFSVLFKNRLNYILSTIEKGGYYGK